jgi:hypothetical protein
VRSPSPLESGHEGSSLSQDQSTPTNLDYADARGDDEKSQAPSDAKPKHENIHSKQKLSSALIQKRRVTGFFKGGEGQEAAKLLSMAEQQKSMTTKPDPDSYFSQLAYFSFKKSNTGLH